MFQTCLKLGLLGLLPITFAHASGLQGFYNNASGLGEAFSGEAAVADDASTEYFNPAGLSRFDHQQLVLGADATKYSNKFSGSTTDFMIGLTQSGTAHSHAYVPWPFLYYTAPVVPKLNFGLGITSPFGIGANFPDDSLVRYNGTSFHFITLDLSPALSYQINKAFSVGVALDVVYLNVMSNLMFPSSTPGVIDSKSLNNATDWGGGWHAGMLYQATPTTRLGLAFHSQVILNPHGKSEFVIVPGSNVGNEIISNNFKFNYILPRSATVSAYHDVNTKVAILGSIDFTDWSSQKHTLLQSFALNGAPGMSTNVDLMQFYQNTFRFSAGTHYKLNPNWMLRAGISYDQDPSNGNYRSANDPGSGSTSIAIGAHYQAMKTLALDMGYQHFFMRASSINLVTPVLSQTGTGQLHQDTIGLQMTWDMA